MARIRTFVAVPLGDAIRGEAVALQDELARAGTEVKWTEEKNLHVTLVFLGEVQAEEVPAVCKIANEAVQGVGPFRTSVGGVGCFPNPRRPRIIWIGVREGTQQIVRIHDALEPPLMDLGYRREDRKYTPHVTLGRVKSDRPTDQLATEIAKRAGWKGGETMVHEIHVMGSELTRDGPVYTVLGRIKL